MEMCKIENRNMIYWIWVTVQDMHLLFLSLTNEIAFPSKADPHERQWLPEVAQLAPW